MLVRDQGRVVNALAAQNVVFTCSTGDVTSTSIGTGAIIDRYNIPQDGPGIVVVPFVMGYSTAGSTNADQKVTVDMKLQHGASSGGGDMADFSTQNQPAARVYFTTAQTTAMQNWSTGAQQWVNNPAVYEISAAKRFLRLGFQFAKNGQTTSTAAGSADRILVNAGMEIRTAEFPSVDTSSTSTSTST